MAMRLTVHIVILAVVQFADCMTHCRVIFLETIHQLKDTPRRLLEFISQSLVCNPTQKQGGTALLRIVSALDK